MGFYPQPNQWLCGPFALKYGLAILGLFENEEAIARVAGTDETGTDEQELARAAVRFGCELLMIRREDPSVAQRELVAHLTRGLPVLLCINEWNHWVTAVREEERRFIILDSHDPAVVRVLPADALQTAWGYHEGARTLYDLHPLVPRRPSRARARLSLHGAAFLAHPENRAFARVWGPVVRDLLVLALPRDTQLSWSVSLADLIREERDSILGQLDHRAGSPEHTAAGRMLEQLRFAAETYELGAPPEDTARLLDGLGAILRRWASGGYQAPPLPTVRPGAT